MILKRSKIFCFRHLSDIWLCAYFLLVFYLIFSQIFNCLQQYLFFILEYYFEGLHALCLPCTISHWMETFPYRLQLKDLHRDEPACCEDCGPRCRWPLQWSQAWCPVYIHLPGSHFLKTTNLQFEWFIMFYNVSKAYKFCSTIWYVKFPCRIIDSWTILIFIPEHIFCDTFSGLSLHANLHSQNSSIHGLLKQNDSGYSIIDVFRLKFA